MATKNTPAVTAIEKDRLFDLTTTGRKSGEARRFEIAFQRVSGKVYISSGPGKHSWYANMLINPKITVHLKQSAAMDIAATARPVKDVAERRTWYAALKTVQPKRVEMWEKETKNWATEGTLVEIVIPGVSEHLA